MAFTKASDIDSRNALAASEAAGKALREKVEKMITSGTTIDSLRGTFDDVLLSEVIREATEAGWNLSLTRMGRGGGELSISLSRKR